MGEIGVCNNRMAIKIAQVIKEGEANNG